MRRSLAKFSGSEASNHTPSLADFTTTTPALKFSVHTGVSVLLPAPQAALQWRMPELTRRRSSDAREECRHVNYGDVHAGTIAIRSNNPIDITG